VSCKELCNARKALKGNAKKEDFKKNPEITPAERGIDPLMHRSGS
jgi:hypothetical protein